MVEYSGVRRNYGVHPSRSLIQWSGSSRGIFWKPQQARSAIADSASITLATHTCYDGIFPLITNETAQTELDLLLAYKGQPSLEKRFSHLKTDFEVAPVYLKEASRIQALLCVYFFALLTESLLERELRRAMDREAIASLPLYPEGRKCSHPTARRLIDLFEDVQRHL